MVLEKVGEFVSADVALILLDILISNILHGDLLLIGKDMQFNNPHLNVKNIIVPGLT